MKRLSLIGTMLLLAFGLVNAASAQANVQMVDVNATYVANNVTTGAEGAVTTEDALILAIPDTQSTQVTFRSQQSSVEIRVCTRAAIEAQTCKQQPVNTVTAGASAPYSVTFTQSTNMSDYFVITLPGGATTTGGQSTNGFQSNQQIGVPSLITLTNDPCIQYGQTGVGNTATFTYTVPQGQVAIVEGFRINGSDDANAPYYTVRQPGTYSDTILDGAVCVGNPNGSYSFAGQTYPTLVGYRQVASRATLIGETLAPLTVPLGGNP